MNDFWYQDTEREDEKRIPFVPFENLLIPSVSLEAIQPPGWTVEEFGPHIRGVQAAMKADDLSLIDVPEGLTAEVMVESVKEIMLYAEAGVAWISNREKLIRLEMKNIRARGTKAIIGRRVVIDEECRIIEGLIFCWALERLGFSARITVILRLNAHPYAGFHHVKDLMDQAQKHRVELDYDRIQELIEAATPAERELLKDRGYYPTREMIELSMSRKTSRLLGTLISKQVGYEANKSPKKKAKLKDLKIRFDPAQLLYVEALREKLGESRVEELDPEADPEGAAKFQRHLDEELAAISAGDEIIAREGSWTRNDDGTFSHWVFPRHRFRIVEPEPEPEAKAELEGEAREFDPYLMDQSQFRIFAKAHFDLDQDDADELHASEGSDGFNRRLRHYIDAAPSAYKVKEPKKPKEPDGARTPKRMALADQPENLSLWNSVLKD